MRLIEVDALKETLNKIPARSIENADGRTYVLIRLSTVFEIIKQMPSVQPDRKKGEWLTSDDFYETSICSRCKWDSQEPTSYAVTNFNFCPNCGCRMNGGM